MTTNWKRDQPIDRVNWRHWIVDWRRQAIFHRDSDRCVWCGGANGLSLDHLTPRGEGGSNTSDNLVCACLACNKTRGPMSLLEWAMVMEDDELCPRGQGERVVSAAAARADFVPIDPVEGKRRVAKLKPATTTQGALARKKTRTTKTATTTHHDEEAA